MGERDEAALTMTFINWTSLAYPGQEHFPMEHDLKRAGFTCLSYAAEEHRLVKAARRAPRIDKKEQSESLAELAQVAAARNQLSELYAIINRLCPRPRKPRAAIRRPDGRKCLDAQDENEVFSAHVENTYQAILNPEQLQNRSEVLE